MAKHFFVIFLAGRRRVLYCQLGQVGRIAERSGGTGKKVSRQRQEVHVSSGRQEIFFEMKQEDCRALETRESKEGAGLAASYHL